MSVITEVREASQRAWSAVYSNENQVALENCDEIEKLIPQISQDFEERIESCWYTVCSIRGIACVANGDVDAGTRLLQESSAHLTCSPTNLTFGPNLTLANCLLSAGVADPVVEFLKSCAIVWPLGIRELTTWIEEIEAGRFPTLKAGIT